MSESSVVDSDNGDVGSAYQAQPPSREINLIQSVRSSPMCKKRRATLPKNNRPGFSPKKPMGAVAEKYDSDNSDGAMVGLAIPKVDALSPPPRKSEIVMK